MGIIQIIIQYIDYKGISKYRFYKETGFSNGFLDKGTKIGSDKCESIYYRYPDINLEWLITGRGTMLRSVESEVKEDINLPNTLVKNESDQSTIVIQRQKTTAHFSDNPFKESDLVIDGLKNRLGSLKTQLAEQKQSYERIIGEKEGVIHGLEARLADKNKQIEDLKNNLGMVIASKDEIIGIQSKRIAEIESRNETEESKKILGTAEGIDQENASLTDIRPKDLSTKAKKSEYQP